MEPRPKDLHIKTSTFEPFALLFLENGMWAGYQVPSFLYYDCIDCIMLIKSHSKLWLII
jgi:hypothetical protein